MTRKGSNSNSRELITLVVSKWTSQEIIIFTLVSSACLCLLLLTLGIVAGVLLKRISPEILGSVNGLAVGTGLLGFGLVIFLIIRAAVSKL